MDKEEILKEDVRTVLMKENRKFSATHTALPEQSAALYVLYLSYSV